MFDLVKRRLSQTYNRQWAKTEIGSCHNNFEHTDIYKLRTAKS